MTNDAKPSKRPGFFSIIASLLESSRRFVINVVWAIILLFIIYGVTSGIGNLFRDDDDDIEFTEELVIPAEMPVFYAKLQGPIVEELTDQEQIQQAFESAFSGSPIDSVDLSLLKKEFENLADNEELSAVVLELGRSLSGSIIERLQLADVIAELRDSTHATVYVLSEDGFAPWDYLLAAAADKIVVGNNSFGVTLVGEGAGSLYLGDMLRSFGINFYHSSTGDHKTAFEELRLGEMSAGERENLQAIISERWAIFREHISANRLSAISLENYPQFATEGEHPLDSLARNYAAALKVSKGDAPAFALSVGLADLLSSQLWPAIAQDLGVDYLEFVLNRYEYVGEYFESDLSESDRLEKAFRKLVAHEIGGGRGADKHSYASDDEDTALIGRLQLEGVIYTPDFEADAADGDGITLADVRRQLEDLDMQDIQALVVEIDSPGGEAIASELVRREIAEFAQARELPVYIWMHRVAASGGYWIAMLSDQVYAHPATITGSIGVVAMVPNFADLAAKWQIGYDQELTHQETAPLTGGATLFEPINPNVQNLLDLVIDADYERFLELVSTSRQISKHEVRQLAGGRVYGAAAALEKGLIDGLIERRDLYQSIAESLGKSDYHTIKSDSEKLSFSQFFSLMSLQASVTRTPAIVNLAERLLPSTILTRIQALAPLLHAEESKPLALCIACLE